MILYLAEAHRHFGCTEIFKEPSKFAWSDYYEEYFVVPYQRIVLVTNKRVMLLQVSKAVSYLTSRYIYCRL
jgi:vacuolar protein sorting-associated protein 13A/C